MDRVVTHQLIFGTHVQDEQDAKEPEAKLKCTAKWCNKEFDDRLKKAVTLGDPAARTKLYEEMQVIMKEEAPDLTIAHSVVYEVMRKGVTGYKQSPFGAHKFVGVDIN
jgi:dipeptide transport system substrate-binding protein